jgi:hypothetical protein
LRTPFLSRFRGRNPLRRKKINRVRATGHLIANRGVGFGKKNSLIEFMGRVLHIHAPAALWRTAGGGHAGRDQAPSIFGWGLGRIDPGAGARGWCARGHVLLDGHSESLAGARGARGMLGRWRHPWAGAGAVAGARGAGAGLLRFLFSVTESVTHWKPTPLSLNSFIIKYLY